MNFALQDLENLKQKLSNIHLLPQPLEDLIPFLQMSEYQLIQLMMQNGVWQPPLPLPPVVPAEVRGRLECGLLPYWANHPPQVIQNFLSGSDPLIKALKFLWDTIARRIPTQIDEANYNSLVACGRTGGLVAPNGIVYGERQYEQLDVRWVWAWIDYLLSHHLGHPVTFGATPAPQIPLAGGTPGEVRIALVGDWGTGDSIAAGVMAQIVGLLPDYIVHLGDVYYAGTAGDYLPLHEATTNLIGFWPPAYAGKSFTLNSNHEMYSGAEGYFQALNAPNSPFSAQNHTGYFALQYGGWTMIGLDTAYFSTTPMVMDGSIGGVNGIQGQWMRSLNVSPGKVILLTHHNGLSDNGTVKQPLWAEINGALGGDPFAWYWGHEHLGVVYTNPTKSNPPSATYCRCLGHGALPYGDASELHGAQGVAWYAHTPQPSSVLVYNGSALLTLKSADGQLTSITEEFYDLGSTTATWSKVLYP
ncbi:MAG TPA: metallophosphoesterase [Terriglobia bacterium]|nr:metallophosphoesterase [Terriglobia bacterium]